MKNILITGGAGFVGSHLAIKIKTRFPSSRITAMDNLHRRGSEINVGRLRAAGVAFIRGDVRRGEDFRKWKGPLSLIIESCAEPSVLAGYQNPTLSVTTNLLGAFHVLELARQKGADLIFLSSSRVYPVDRLLNIHLRQTKSRFEVSARQSLEGISAKGVSERFLLPGYRSIYGASKLAGELLIQEYVQGFGLRAVINRCSVVTGPGQFGRLDQGVFGYWMLAHYFQKKLAYIGFGGQGKQVRDLLHVDDLAELVLIQIQNIKKFHGDIYNVGGGRDRTLSLRETTALCQELTGHRVKIRAIRKNRTADVPLYYTDNSKVTRETGWRPRRTPRQTLTDILAWIRDNEKALARILLP